MIWVGGNSFFFQNTNAGPDKTSHCPGVCDHRSGGAAPVRSKCHGTIWETFRRLEYGNKSKYIYIHRIPFFHNFIIIVIWLHITSCMSHPHLFSFCAAQPALPSGRRSRISVKPVKVLPGDEGLGWSRTYLHGTNISHLGKSDFWWDILIAGRVAVEEWDENDGIAVDYSSDEVMIVAF